MTKEKEQIETKIGWNELKWYIKAVVVLGWFYIAMAGMIILITVAASIYGGN